MSNLLTQNPAIVSAPMSAGYKASVQSTLGAFQYVRIAKVRWDNPGAAGQQVIIIDPSTGQTRFQLTAGAQFTPVEEDFESEPITLNDFQVTVVPSGAVLIYLR